MDDGYSGTTFDRPDWNRLMELLDGGKLGTIVVKDMSCLGRDYLKVGMYTEMIFPNATYRQKDKEICPPHQIRNSVIEKYVLAGLHEIVGYMQSNEDEFVELITKKSRAEGDRILRDSKRELEKSQVRINKLVEIIQRLYEDNIEGKISDECFAKMSENYEAEQTTLECRVTELRGMIAS